MATESSRIEPGMLPASETDYWRLSVTLRDYQKEALAAILRQHKGTVVLPTAAGKTEVAISALVELKIPTVILVPTKALIDQSWVPRLRGAGIRPGVWFGEEHTVSPVIVATYQSLFRDPQLIRNYPFIVADESDLITGDEWSALLREVEFHPYALLLTATPPKEPERAKLLETFAPIIYRKSPAEMITSGHFVRVEPVPYYVSLSAPELTRYKDITEKLRNIVRKLGTGNPREIASMTQSSSADTRNLAFGYLKLLNERTNLLAATPSKSQALLDIARLHPDQRILVFGTRVETINDACRLLSASGIPCRTVTGDTSREARKEIFENWGRTFQIVASVGVLTRGINVPEVGIAVMLGGGRGERALVQKIGRIVRPLPGKEYAIVYVVMAKDTLEAGNYPTVKALFSETQEHLPGAEGPSATYGGGAFRVGRGSAPRQQQPFSQEYYSGRRFSTNLYQIWQGTLTGRLQFRVDQELVRKIREVKPQGGIFVKNGPAIYTKTDQGVVKIDYDWNPEPLA